MSRVLYVGVDPAILIQRREGIQRVALLIAQQSRGVEPRKVTEAERWIPTVGRR